MPKDLNVNVTLNLIMMLLEELGMLAILLVRVVPELAPALIPTIGCRAWAGRWAGWLVIGGAAGGVVVSIQLALFSRPVSGAGAGVGVASATDKLTRSYSYSHSILAGMTWTSVVFIAGWGVLRLSRPALTRWHAVREAKQAAAQVSYLAGQAQANRQRVEVLAVGLDPHSKQGRTYRFHSRSGGVVYRTGVGLEQQEQEQERKWSK